MKYPTKVDLWLAIAIAVSALIPISIAVFGFLSEGTASEAGWVAALIFALTTCVVAAVSVPTYYELQSDSLVVRCGLLRWTIQLEEIVSVTPTSNPLSSPAWALDRLEVRSRRAGRDRVLLISPKRRDEFLRDLQAKSSALVLEGDALRRAYSNLQMSETRRGRACPCPNRAKHDDYHWPSANPGSHKGYPYKGASNRKSL